MAERVVVVAVGGGVMMVVVVAARYRLLLVRHRLWLRIPRLRRLRLSMRTAWARGQRALRWSSTPRQLPKTMVWPPLAVMTMPTPAPRWRNRRLPQRVAVVPVPTPLVLLAPPA